MGWVAALDGTGVALLAAPEGTPGLVNGVALAVWAAAWERAAMGVAAGDGTSDGTTKAVVTTTAAAQDAAAASLPNLRLRARLLIASNASARWLQRLDLAIQPVVERVAGTITWRHGLYPPSSLSSPSSLWARW